MGTYKTFSQFIAAIDKSFTPYQYGRALYRSVECGPWISYILTPKGKKLNNNEDLYYEDELAKTNKLNKYIKGIKIGSIVEGKDADVTPITLMFPFSEKDYDNAVENVNSEAKYIFDSNEE